METATLTLQLPKDEIALAERYAQAHHLSLPELISRLLRRWATEPSPERPAEGLGVLAGRWDDGEEFAQEVDRVVAQRSGRHRPSDFAS